MHGNYSTGSCRAAARPALTAAALIMALAVFAGDCEAVSALERFFLSHPDLTRILAVSACVFMLAAAVLLRVFFGGSSRGHASGYGGAPRAAPEAPGAGTAWEKAAGPAKLVEIHSSKNYQLPSTGEFTIGRTFSNSMVLRSSSVSRVHAKITVEDGTHVIYDMGSKKGTMVNGELVQRHVLRDADIIEIGRDDFFYTLSRD